MQKRDGQLIFSPTDLIRYLASPFASWMDRYNLENPGAVQPDKETEDEILIAQTGVEHERVVLGELKLVTPQLVEISNDNFSEALARTRAAIEAKSPIIYQGALQHGRFAGYSDFLTLDETGLYQVWDTKLARSPKPYYAVQLCCYSEMLAPFLRQDALKIRDHSRRQGAGGVSRRGLLPLLPPHKVQLPRDERRVHGQSRGLSRTAAAR